MQTSCKKGPTEQLLCHDKSMSGTVIVFGKIIMHEKQDSKVLLDDPYISCSVRQGIKELWII